MTSSTDEIIIPAAPDELVPSETAKRLPGQDFGSPGSDYPAPAVAGHKADDDSFYRSRNLVYKRKILKQKARTKA
jgi:hypothetical protein